MYHAWTTKVDFNKLNKTKMEVRVRYFVNLFVFTFVHIHQSCTLCPKNADINNTTRQFLCGSSSPVLWQFLCGNSLPALWYIPLVVSREVNRRELWSSSGGQPGGCTPPSQVAPNPPDPSGRVHCRSGGQGHATHSYTVACTCHHG